MKINNRIQKIYRLLYSSFGSQHWWPGDTRFEIMVGAILTQNTNWRNVTRAIDNIKRARLLDPKKLLKNRRLIPRLIKPSGFYKLKTKRLLAFLNYYVNTYNGNIENVTSKTTEILRNELLAIPGIGYETADSILLYAFARPVFVVDIYTRRIFSRHNIVDPGLPYDAIRTMFEKHLPKNAQLYNEYHALLVKCGKEYCKKNEPWCTTCPLRNVSL